MFTKKQMFSEWHIHPSRDWAIILGSVVVCMLCVNIGIFFFTEKIASNVVSEVTPVYTLDVDVIHAIAEKYRGKEERFRAIVGDTSHDVSVGQPDSVTSVNEGKKADTPVVD